ncbi:MAG: SDR family oxidoreductase [Chloroflexi bacterium]|nr:SDR family oxidoreductase [Chloroflexota bacterium]
MPVPVEWSLVGKTVFMATSGRGWTPSLATALAEAGADVTVTGLPREELDRAVAAVEAYGRRVLAIPADLTRPAQVRRAVAEARKAFGAIDALVNNAQVEFGKPFLEVTLREFDSLMAQNVRSAFLCCQEVGKEMLRRGKGHIVNISSGLAVRGLWNSAVYCASMGALYQLTQALALEWGKSGVRVNGIGPGWFTAKEIPLEEQQKELLVRYLPSRRLGHPRDIAALLVYLCSDACSYVNGQTIFVDGGALAHA